MRRFTLRSWKAALILPWSRSQGCPSRPPDRSRASKAGPVKVAIMTDCKGAFAFGYDSTSAGRRVRSRSSPTV